MNRLSKENKARVQQFVAITGASEKVAGECLKKTSWNLEPAIDHFYSSGLAATSSCTNQPQIHALYLKYKEKDGDMIQADGVAAFCEDLGVDPADIVMLVISFHMNAAAMCEFSKDEFINGMLRMGCDSIEKLKNRLPVLRSELKHEEMFKDIYNFAYMFSREKGQKCVQFEVAVAMWRLLLSEERSWPLINDWCEFLQKHHTNRAISKDTWQQLLDFIKTIKPDFSNFDETAAWPYLLDEFVSYMKEKRAA